MKRRGSSAKTVTDRVVDASAVVALLFNELTRDSVVTRLRGGSLLAPGLIVFEAASACLKKIRAAPSERQALLEAFSLMGELAIALEPVDLREAISLADQTKLTLYDASYLWLALTLDAELITLDVKLARADAALRGSNLGR
jgi:predicted nucleic acid-binding protein